MKNRNQFNTVVEGHERMTDDSPFPIVDPPPYGTIEEIPRSVRLLIAQGALLRALSSEMLAEFYGIPVAWVDEIIETSTPEDIEERLRVGGVPLGTTEH
jgi:hypothetical protein